MINLAYDDTGAGDAVVFIAGRGGPGRTWHIHQVPAFVAAGYRVVTFDNRGIGATENADAFSTRTMVGDTATLIEELGLAPARIVGVSMGSYIAQELMLARPELVSQAVLMATHARRDRLREFFYQAEGELGDIEIPPMYAARMRLLESFSPKTLNDDAAVRDWIDMFTVWPVKPTPGFRAQRNIGPQTSRLSTYRSIATPTLVIGFADDLVLPPHLSKEVAAALPNGRYLEFRDAGHLGFLERPKAVNTAILQFFADAKL